MNESICEVKHKNIDMRIEKLELYIQSIDKKFYYIMIIIITNLLSVVTLLLEKIKI